MTSSDGITWTGRTAISGYDVWQSIIYANGLFVVVGGNQIATSADGINWTTRTTESYVDVSYGNGIFTALGSNNTNSISSDGVTWTNYSIELDSVWSSSAFGTSTLVAVGANGISLATSRGPTYSATNTSITLTAYTPSVSDLSKILVLQSTSSAITTAPTEGTAYATGTLIGTAAAICSTTVAASTTYTCTSSGLTNGTPYYFRFYTQDTSGNWSTGAEPYGNPISPGTTTVTLGGGVDQAGGTIAPGSSATTSDTFTFQTSVGSSTISSVTVTTASTTATSTSLVEITNNTGTTVYGSSTNPASDSITIPLTMNTLTATSGLTQYKIRITPKSHANMPAPPGSTYYLTSSISSWVDAGAKQAGVDATTTATTTVLAIDNTSPDDVDALGVKWRSRVSAGDNQWMSVAYGSSTFVAVSFDGTGNHVMTSPDGITWTLRTSAADNGWNSVTYASSTFVAVAQSCSGNCVMTSPDGITWTSRTSAADNNWISVIYGNGLFVAVSNSGTSNRVMTSPDGVTWTSRTSAADIQWDSVTYGNGIFVVVSADGTTNDVMTSPDGITWTLRSNPNTNGWKSVTYGNGLFVAVGQSGTGNRVMTSSDGITWTSRTSAADSAWDGVTYGNGLFMAVAYSCTSICAMTSPDGITWTSQLLPTTASSVVYGTSTFVAVSYAGTGNRVMTSRGPTFTATSTSISITSFTPSITDLSKILILQSTSSAITTAPTEGTAYATGTLVGTAAAVCSTTVAASTTYTCTSTGLTAGLQYYYKIYTQDTSGNWSTGVIPYGIPASPGNKIVTLGGGTDQTGGTLLAGAAATTSDTFTFQTSTSTDIITSATVTFATTTAQSLSLVEITNNAGTTVYGSTTNPLTDTPAILLNNNTLTATTGLTQYRIRVTPKSAANMPAVPGATYSITSYISSWIGTNATQAGADATTSTTTVLTIDNLSPDNPTSISAAKNTIEQIIISYTSATTTDAQDTLVLRSTATISDVPVEGTSYAAGNTIGASTVTCVASSSPLGGAKTCTYASPLRSTNYYFKLFTKDTTGNYSGGGTANASVPLFIRPPNAGALILDTDVFYGGTTTRSGGSGSGGGFDTGSSTATTTTSTTTPGKGGGSGDSGFLYHGSTLADDTTTSSGFFSSVLNFLTKTFFTGATPNAYASNNTSNQEDSCYLELFDICIVHNVPWQ
jgi:hypothetical protein